MTDERLLSVDEIEAIADSLTPVMRHALLRCSDAVDWTIRDRTLTWPRDWCDVVANYPHASYRGTIGALKRRGLVVEKDHRGIRATVTGYRVQAALRVRQ